jgi:hypothetical protein
MPRQMQDTLQFPAGHDRGLRPFVFPPPVMTVFVFIIITTNLQRQEFCRARLNIEELRGGVEVFSDPAHGHVGVGTLEPAIVSINRRIEPSGDVVALVIVVVGFPVVPDGVHE